MKHVALACIATLAALAALTYTAALADDFPKPYDPRCTEREDVFEFAKKPTVHLVGKDRYEIAFTVKGYCDVTVDLIDKEGTVVRHVASGVLGKNAPASFRKDSLEQKILWDGKDDLGTYVREPEKLTARVMLGLKPEFDNLLGPASPKALPGALWGVAADADGVYVFTRAGGKVTWRKFDHDAHYVRDLYPPSGKLSPEKLGGMGYVEYEPGKRAIHAPDIQSGMWHYASWSPTGVDGVWRCRPVAVNGRIYLLSSGHGQEAPGSRRSTANYLHYFNTDGSTEYDGVTGRPWVVAPGGTSISPHLAASPDGKTLYVTGLHGAGVWGSAPASPVLMSGPAAGDERANVLVGDFKKVGGDDRSFSDPKDVACDPSGRVYVVDSVNRRIQIFSPEGKFLKTLKVNRPDLVQVHQKTGQVYVAHSATVRGKSVGRITRFSPFPELAEERHWDGVGARIMTLDSWAPKPRLWISGRTAGSGTRVFADTDGLSETESTTKGALLLVYEDAGEELRLLSDFEKEARKEAGGSEMEFAGGIKYPVVCDPVTEKAYYCNKWIFDLRTGKSPGSTEHNINVKSGLAFCKRGYMHVHVQHRDQKIMCRLDPKRVVHVDRPGRSYTKYAEVPYDYGVDMMGCTGALRMPTTDDKYYSWGMGVNMRGEIAVLNMFKVTANATLPVDASLFKSARGGTRGGPETAAQFARKLEERRILDAQGYVAYIRPKPGIDVVGAVIWTFDSTGEEKDKEAAIVGGFRTNGVQLDEDGYLYFANGRLRYAAGKPFLQGRGGNFGGKPYLRWNRSPFTGTYVKAPPKRASFILRNAVVPSDTLPARQPDLIQTGEGAEYKVPDNDVWAEGVEWLYAGVSPIVSYHCSCMDMRACLDWYKRSFVPEMYRHSIGILDTGGNLICRVGRYGNLDEGGKPAPGNDGVVMTRGAYVSTTDNYMVIADWGRRLISAKLGYRATETAAVPGT